MSETPGKMAIRPSVETKTARSFRAVPLHSEYHTRNQLPDQGPNFGEVSRGKQGGRH